MELLWPDKDLLQTITADNGAEFHGYKSIEAILDVDVYFATPHHAWERGTNENTNGLIRQYLPKGMALDDLCQSQCNQIAEKLNNRPRKRLGYKTPNEPYGDLPIVALQTSNYSYDFAGGGPYTNFRNLNPAILSSLKYIRRLQSGPSSPP